MAANMAYAGTAPGFFKILHILFGIIVIACGATSYESEFAFERMFFWSAVTAFIVTILYLLLHLGSDGISRSTAFKGVDILYHILGGIILIVGGSLMIASVKKIEKKFCTPNPWGVECQDRRSVKLAAGSMSVINGVLYLITVVLIAATRQEEPADLWESKIRGYTAPSSTTRERGTADDSAAE